MTSLIDSTKYRIKKFSHINQTGELFMKRFAALIVISIFSVTLVFAQKADKKKTYKSQKAKEVSFKSSDGVELFADVYKSKKGKKAPLIMLFHQGGGDARGEYKPLVPKLLKQNYNVIAVDLRTGGNRFGSENRTVAKLGDKKYGYCDAFPDLQATLKYAKSKGFNGKKIAWGSSFSAALVFQLAAKHGDELAGILAFSPASGGPMVDCKPSLYSSKVKIPVLALRPASEMKFESVQNQFAAFKKQKIQTYVSENGVHGSSMLNAERVKGDVENHWTVVLDFIKNSLK